MITVEEARRIFEYDPETGQLIRKISSKRNRRNKPTGNGSKRLGYREVWVGYQRFLVHRLVWLMVYGEWPSGFIDHINRDPTDNRLCNLRLATNSQNQANRPAPKNNTSGFKGVSWHEQAKKWRTTLWVRGKRKELGEFRNFEIACSVYVEAAIEHFGEFAHVD